MKNLLDAPEVHCNKCDAILTAFWTGWICPSGCGWEEAGRRWKDHPGYLGNGKMVDGYGGREK